MTRKLDPESESAEIIAARRRESSPSFRSLCRLARGPEPVVPSEMVGIFNRLPEASKDELRKFQAWVRSRAATQRTTQQRQGQTT